ncbi:MAG: tetratricopeptide repeat-containing serine/threonine-protein kinase, partial [Acidobacteriota bacterium]|nr:tetratricopeptide repeat-containing serine/threonine-protein kinase [Acidobacteriota bacterium]
ALRREVESLLEYEGAADAFLARPAIEDAAAALAQDPDVSLVGQRIGGYHVLSLLGAGGMGEVYRAKDLRLEREVALKLLAPGLASDPGYVRRFEEEARSASVLNHPNIVTIYGVGEDGDITYIAMELVQGRTLRGILASGTLPIKETVELAAQLATALAAAHAAGIVHRDLKPENVMVTADGHLKVLDFGIAKRDRRVGIVVAVPAAIAAARTGTQAGPILGTAGYMSPEQAAGRSVTFTSDQFSLGAILYEMLSGRRAFERSTKQATLAAIISDEPDPLDSLTTDIPVALRRLVERCLAKDAGQRYPDTGGLALELRGIRERIDRDERATGISRRRALWLGAAATAVTALGATAWQFRPHTRLIRSLAVLPFTNVTNDETAEYLCDGITESLIRRLSPLASLNVMARNTVFNFKGKKTSPRDAGAELHVDAVLTGTLERRSGRLQINTELVDVATGAQLWSRVYDRTPADLLAVQEEIVLSIIDEGIRLPLSHDERRQLARKPTENVDAYVSYVQALYFHRLGTEADYLTARRLLFEAVGRDPAFALAYVSLASTFTVMAVDGFESSRDASPQWLTHIQRAMSLERDLPEAHAEKASGLFFFRHQWTDAEREWRRALEFRNGHMLPDLVGAFALFLWALGRAEEALQWARKAREIDTQSSKFLILEADLSLHAGQFDAARRLYDQAIAQLQEDPRPYFGLAEVFRRQGRFDEAIEARRKAHAAAGDESLRQVLDTARGEAGYRRIEQAGIRLDLAQLTTRSASGAYVSPLDLARAHAQLGETTEAFRLIQLAFADQTPALAFLNVDPAW